MSCRSVIGVPNGFAGLKFGRYVCTGASRSIAPRSTSCMTPMSVNSFETEPTRYTVLAVAGTPPSVRSTPNPRDQTTAGPSTSAIDSAGIPLSRISRSMNAVSALLTSAYRATGPMTSRPCAVSFTAVSRTPMATTPVAAPRHDRRITTARAPRPSRSLCQDARRRFASSSAPRVAQRRHHQRGWHG
jgi:hypothetical protein